MKKALYVIVIMILIIAFCVSAFLVARYVLEGRSLRRPCEHQKSGADQRPHTGDEALDCDRTLKARI